jgi:hypothetical protein
VFGEDQQQAIVDADRFIDLFVDFLAGLYVVFRESATNAFVLKIGVHPLGEFLILRRVADEAGIKVKRAPKERRQIFDEGVGQATPA